MLPSLDVLADANSGKFFGSCPAESTSENSLGEIALREPAAPSGTVCQSDGNYESREETPIASQSPLPHKEVEERGSTNSGRSTPTAHRVHVSFPSAHGLSSLSAIQRTVLQPTRSRRDQASLSRLSPKERGKSSAAAAVDAVSRPPAESGSYSASQTGLGSPAPLSFHIESTTFVARNGARKDPTGIVSQGRRGHIAEAGRRSVYSRLAPHTQHHLGACTAAPPRTQSAPGRHAEVKEATLSVASARATPRDKALAEAERSAVRKPQTRLSDKPGRGALRAPDLAQGIPTEEPSRAIRNLCSPLVEGDSDSGPKLPEEKRDYASDPVTVHLDRASGTWAGRKRGTADVRLCRMTERDACHDVAAEFLGQPPGGPKITASVSSPLARHPAHWLGNTPEWRRWADRAGRHAAGASQSPGRFLAESLTEKTTAAWEHSSTVELPETTPERPRDDNVDAVSESKPETFRTRVTWPTAAAALPMSPIKRRVGFGRSAHVYPPAVLPGLGTAMQPLSTLSECDRNEEACKGFAGEPSPGCAGNTSDATPDPCVPRSSWCSENSTRQQTPLSHKESEGLHHRGPEGRHVETKARAHAPTPQSTLAGMVDCALRDQSMNYSRQPRMCPPQVGARTSPHTSPGDATPTPRLPGVQGTGTSVPVLDAAAILGTDTGNLHLRPSVSRREQALPSAPVVPDRLMQPNTPACCPGSTARSRESITYNTWVKLVAMPEPSGAEVETAQLRTHVKNPPPTRTESYPATPKPPETCQHHAAPRVARGEVSLDRSYSLPPEVTVKAELQSSRGQVHVACDTCSETGSSTWRRQHGPTKGPASSMAPSPQLSRHSATIHGRKEFTHSETKNPVACSPRVAVARVFSSVVGCDSAVSPGGAARLQQETAATSRNTSRRQTVPQGAPLNCENRIRYRRSLKAGGPRTTLLGGMASGRACCSSQTSGAPGEGVNYRKVLTEGPQPTWRAGAICSLPHSMALNDHHSHSRTTAFDENYGKIALGFRSETLVENVHCPSLCERAAGPVRPGVDAPAGTLPACKPNTAHAAGCCSPRAVSGAGTHLLQVPCNTPFTGTTPGGGALCDADRLRASAVSGHSVLSGPLPHASSGTCTSAGSTWQQTTFSGGTDAVQMAVVSRTPTIPQGNASLSSSTPAEVVLLLRDVRGEVASRPGQVTDVVTAEASLNPVRAAGNGAPRETSQPSLAPQEAFFGQTAFGVNSSPGTVVKMTFCQSGSPEKPLYSKNQMDLRFVK